MLQALHGVIKVGGQRMSEKHREEILSTLVTLQGTAHEQHRSVNLHFIHSNLVGYAVPIVVCSPLILVGNLR